MPRGRPRTLLAGTTTRQVRQAVGARRVDLMLSSDEAGALHRLREAAGESTDAGMLRRMILKADEGSAT